MSDTLEPTLLNRMHSRTAATSKYWKKAQSVSLSLSLSISLEEIDAVCEPCSHLNFITAEPVMKIITYSIVYDF